MPLLSSKYTNSYIDVVVIYTSKIARTITNLDASFWDKIFYLGVRLGPLLLLLMNEPVAVIKYVNHPIQKM